MEKQLTFATTTKSVVITFNEAMIAVVDVLLNVKNLERKKILEIKRSTEGLQIKEGSNYLLMDYRGVTMLWSYDKLVFVRLVGNLKRRSVELFTEHSCYSSTTRRHLSTHGRTVFDKKFEIRTCHLEKCVNYRKCFSFDIIGTPDITISLPEQRASNNQLLFPDMTRKQLSLFILTAMMIEHPRTWVKRGLSVDGDGYATYRYKNIPLAINLNKKTWNFMIICDEKPIFTATGKGKYDEIQNSYPAYDYINYLSRQRAIDAIEEEMTKLLD